MAQLSSQGSNAIIYLTYAFLLATGLAIAYRFYKADSFLSHNGSQRGLPLALNFIASGKYFCTQGSFFLFFATAGVLAYLIDSQGLRTKPPSPDQVHTCVGKLYSFPY